MSVRLCLDVYPADKNAIPAGTEWEEGRVVLTVDTFPVLVDGHLTIVKDTTTDSQWTVWREDCGLGCRCAAGGVPGVKVDMSDIDVLLYDGARAKACSDFAPDSWNPVEADRDICTNCFYREVDHDTLRLNVTVEGIGFLRAGLASYRAELCNAYTKNEIRNHLDVIDGLLDNLRAAEPH